jgi:hypothetical protein
MTEETPHGDRWHPQPAEWNRTEDKDEVYKYPCCGHEWRIYHERDGAYSAPQYADHGCQPAPEK